MNEITVEGLIYHGPGGCPICSGALHVYDCEISLMELNQEGIPIDEETEIRCNAICGTCGHKLEMVRWEGGYIPYGESALTIKQMQRRDESRDRVKRMNEKGKEKNPFTF